MHEMSLVHDLVDVVVEHAQKNGMAQVKAVYLTIGQGRDIVVEFLDGLFKHLARNTIAAGADIVVEQLPITVVSDGRLLRENLQKSGKTEAWLQKTLKKEKATVKSTWLLTVDRAGQVIFYPKEGRG